MKYLPKYKQCEKKIKKLFRFILVCGERCRNLKSGYQKRGRTDGCPINLCFLRANTFDIVLKIMFLKILNEEITISCRSNYDYIC